MKKNLIFTFSGLIIGSLLTVLVMYNAAPGMMILEDESPYSFEETVAIFEKSVKDNNWKIPHVHDLQKTMAKFDKDVKSVKVFELCHPTHAGKILEESDERIVSSLMPCRVAIYEKHDGKVYFSRLNSGMMAGMMGGLIADVMQQASAENEEILLPLLQSNKN